jgi:hypothetical protein|tara:strand:- start:129 stop:707 length:579 start_codon:yes stop_codon:yes gene_type:complete
MITSDQTWRNTKLQEWVGYYEDIIPKDECKNLIRDVKNSGLLKPSTYSNHTGEIKRSDNRVVMDDMWVKDKTTSSIINDFFGKVIRKYSDKFERFSCQRHSGFRVNRYSSGGFMSEHTDNIHHSHGQQYGFPQVSALLFLNDNYKGGEFIVAGNEYETKIGSGIIFPSNFMFPHEVKKITHGERWSIVTWLM